MKGTEFRCFLVRRTGLEPVRSPTRLKRRILLTPATLAHGVDRACTSSTCLCSIKNQRCKSPAPYCGVAALILVLFASRGTTAQWPQTSILHRVAGPVAAEHTRVGAKIQADQPRSVANSFCIGCDLTISVLRGLNVRVEIAIRNWRKCSRCNFAKHRAHDKAQITVVADGKPGKARSEIAIFPAWCCTCSGPA